MNPVVLINWPEIKITFHGGGVRLAEKREETGGMLAFPASNYDEWPGRLPLAIFLFALVNPREKGPQNGRHVAVRRALQTVKRQNFLLPHLVGRPNVGGLVGKERP